MTDPKVTVLMSVYNGERFLRESMESILNQTFTDFEFLINNDGSTDGSYKIIHSYNDPRIRLIKNEKNIGLTKSLNKGLKAARGKYIARMDADDISLPQRLERQVAILENNKDFKLVGSWTEIIDKDGKTIDLWNTTYSPEYIYYILHFGNCLTHTAAMFDRELGLALNGYDEDIEQAQDFELWTRFNKRTRIIQIQEVLVKWRKVDTGISVQHRAIQDMFVSKIVSRNIKDLIGKAVNVEYLKLMAGDLTVLKEFSNKNKKKTLKYLKVIHKNILKHASDVVHITTLKRVIDKRFNYMSQVISVDSTITIAKRYIAKILGFIDA